MILYKPSIAHIALWDCPLWFFFSSAFASLMTTAEAGVRRILGSEFPFRVGQLGVIADFAPNEQTSWFAANSRATHFILSIALISVFRVLYPILKYCKVPLWRGQRKITVHWPEGNLSYTLFSHIGTVITPGNIPTHFIVPAMIMIIITVVGTIMRTNDDNDNDEKIIIVTVVIIIIMIMKNVLATITKLIMTAMLIVMMKYWKW